MSRTVVRSLTLSLDTSAYGAGDVLAATQELPDAVMLNDLGGMLQTVTVIDKDDQGAAFTIYIMDANVAFGSENAAPSITDANAEAILGAVSIGTGDYVDFGGARVAYKGGLNIPIKPADGTRSIYVAVVNGAGTPTYTASGIVLRFGIQQI
jgi:hypothetical protein